MDEDQEQENEAGIPGTDGGLVTKFNRRQKTPDLKPTNRTPQHIGRRQPSALSTSTFERSLPLQPFPPLTRTHTHTEEVCVCVCVLVNNK